jgi:hypothetical protein
MDDKRDERFIDELLDASLRHYRSENPRAGLENRILAHVRAAGQAARPRGLWVWAIAASTAIVMIAAAAAYISRRQPATPVATVNRSVIDRGPFQSTTTHGQKGTDRGYPLARPTSSAQRALPGTIRQVAAKARRPGQFPTLAPLSEEEKLLLAYASQVPISKLDDLMNRDPKIEPLEIPELKIPRIEIEEIPKLGE